MNIIHFILGKANPDRMNGVNRVVYNLASQQHLAGYAVAVWGLTDNPVHDYPERIFATRLFARPAFPFALPADLKAAINQVEPGTVFHLHGGFVPQMYTLSRYLSRNHIPYVITPHGSYNMLAMKRSLIRKKCYAALFEKPLLRQASKIHLLGHSEATILKQWSFLDKAFELPYGFDAGAMTTDASKPAGFRIGFCGRIDIFTKGLDALLDGFARFHEIHPDSELHLIGDGSDMNALRQRIDRSTAANAIYTHGSMYGKEKEQLIRSFHLFAHPSRNEGLPTAVLEAAALGVPCLLTEATNMASYIRQYAAGYSIEQTTADAVLHGLEQMYRAIVPEQKGGRLEQNARNMVQNAFNWSRLIREYMTMYQNALS